MTIHEDHMKRWVAKESWSMSKTYFQQGTYALKASARSAVICGTMIASIGYQMVRHPIQYYNYRVLLRERNNRTG